MAREQTETEIDGVKFRMALLRPSEARQLMARIGKVAGHGFLERATKIDAKDPGAAVIGMMLSAMGDPSFAAEQEAVFAVLGKVSEMEVGDGKFVPSRRRTRTCISCVASSSCTDGRGSACASSSPIFSPQPGKIPAPPSRDGRQRDID